MIKIGELRDRISIEKEVEFVNDYGGTESTYQTIYSCRAKVKTVSTKEYITSNSESFLYTLKFICRKHGVLNLSDGVSYIDSLVLSNTHFLVFKNQRYNIKHIHEFEDNKYIEITGERVI